MDAMLRTGDQAMYNPIFGSAVVTVMPGILTGTVKTTNASKSAICVQGDEKSATVPGCAYIAGSFVTPGVGILSITSLGLDQLSQKTRCGGKPIILQGTTFTAQFQVVVPATMPTVSGPVPDPVPLYPGTGHFQTLNLTVIDKG